MMILSTKLGAVTQINPRFGTNTAQSAWTLITYPLSDITLKKTYCVPLFQLFRKSCP